MAKNLLVEDRSRPTVHVAHGNGPYANTRQALEAFDLHALRGKRVLLKPNAGRVAAPQSGVVTNPEVVAAAIDAFREAGTEVAVGESPIVGVKTLDALDAAGIAAAAAERDCPLIDLDRRQFVEVPIPGGVAIHSLRVCADVLEFDFIVSIPVMKMHMHTGVTLAVKNMKGCLWRRSKVELHMLPAVERTDAKPIDVAIADMASVLRADLAIIDGTVGLEGLGPSAGEPKPLGAVVASADPLAADAVACRLMGTQAERIGHLRLAAERGYGVINLDRVTVQPGCWHDWISPFAPPPENLSMEFPGIKVWDKQSCSACQSTLLLFLTRYHEQLSDYFPGRDRINIAIGRGNDPLPSGTLCIGNCTARGQTGGLFVPGCPPVGSQILEVVSADRKQG